MKISSRRSGGRKPLPSCRRTRSWSNIISLQVFLFIIGRMMCGVQEWTPSTGMNFSFMLVAPCKFLVPIFSFRVILILEYMMRSIFHYFILV